MAAPAANSARRTWVIQDDRPVLSRHRMLVLGELRRPEASVPGRDQHTPVDQGVHEGERVGRRVEQAEGISPGAARGPVWWREGLDESGLHPMRTATLRVDSYFVREEVVHSRPQLQGTIGVSHAHASQEAAGRVRLHTTCREVH